MARSPQEDQEPLLPPPVTSRSASTSTSPSTSPSSLRSAQVPMPRSPYHPNSTTSTTSSVSTPRSKLNARRTSGLSTLSEKSKGKQRAEPESPPFTSAASHPGDGDRDLDTGPYLDRDDASPRSRFRNLEEEGGGWAKNREKEEAGAGRGRHVTVVFSNESESGGGNLELWVEDGESVGSVKEKIRHLRPTLAPLSLRLIHAGRLLTDGILLVPWLKSLEERVRRQAGGMGGDVESVLREVGLQDDDDDDDPVSTGTDDSSSAAVSASASRGKGDGARSGDTARARAGRKEKGKGKEKNERVWLHCNVGGRLDDINKAEKEETEETQAPRRRGFDVLLDAGLSPADVANMRRQFYESRGEEVPEGMDLGDVNDEHARALEEQWIEGDLTAETATTTTEGMYTSILHGLLTGFLFPITPWFFFRDAPLPNFFDADAEARGEDDTPVSQRVSSNPETGGEVVPSVVFGKRMQIGILLGTIINVAFGWLRFLN